MEKFVSVPNGAVIFRDITKKSQKYYCIVDKEERRKLFTLRDMDFAFSPPDFTVRAIELSLSSKINVFCELFNCDNSQMVDFPVNKIKTVLMRYCSGGNGLVHIIDSN